MDARCADAVFYNGRVITMDSGHGIVRAVAVAEGKIAGLGDDKEMRAVAPRGSDRIDLGGRTVLPGFIDCHTHFIQMGVDSMSVDLSRTRSIDEALAAMRDAAKKTPEGAWVIGANWKESGWKDGRFITGKDLDGCCPKHPAVAHRVCGHMSSVNSLAISTLGITPETPDVDRDSSGRVTGVLTESAVVIARNATAPDKAKKAKALAIATKRAYSLGVTSIHDNGLTADFGIYHDAEVAGKLGIRVWFNFPASELDKLNSLSLSKGVGSDWLRVGGVKLFCDGALGARSAALSEPYADDPGNKGIFVQEDSEFEGVVSKANAAGHQLAIHAIGDMGVEATISALEAALADSPMKDHRHRIEHLELPSRAHLMRMRKSKIIASMQPNFIGEWGGTDGMYLSRLGAKRTSWNNPFAEVLKAKLKLVFGSDCMPFSPLYGLHSAVNAPHASQKIDVASAVAAYTADAAFASFDEKRKGSLSEGKFADFIVLSDDPFEAPSMISSMSVLKTIVGGNIVYEKRRAIGG